MIIETYSRRNADPCAEPHYGSINRACRIQIFNIIEDFMKFNTAASYAEEYFWPDVEEFIKDEHGREHLYMGALYRGLGGHISSYTEVKEYFKGLEDIDKQLDVIEIIFSLLPTLERHLGGRGYQTPFKAQMAVEDLNKRLAQHCIGFKFEGKHVVKVDNELLYATITKETFKFLANPIFKNVNEEYLQAHRQLRSGNFKDCIVNCAKAFESTIKIICDQRGFKHQSGYTASKLLNVLYQNDFIPSYLQTGVTALRSLLETIATVRNKTSAHGSGSTNIEVNENFANYALNITGSNIKFLVSLME